jgi:serine/threonine protein kinase
MLGRDRSELGGCRLIRRIGAGGMGEVFLAEQVSLGNRLVAVKIVHAEHDVTPPPGAAEDVGWHFIREAQLLGRLAHPNILPVYHCGIEAGYLFLVMQYAPDGSLADAIQGEGVHRLALPASLPWVVDLVAQVADALQYTHEHQVIHADVKPSNVLMQVEPNGHWHVLLADFGVARNVDSIALRSEVAGTAAYMAPEQFYGQLSPACDQYALGVMAFQLLAGRLPFSGGLVELAQAHARQAPPGLRAINPAIPPALEAVLVRALAKRSEDRYPSAAAFAHALRTASTGANTTVAAASRPGAVWADLPVDRPDAATARTVTARTAPAPTWTNPSPTEPPPASCTFPPTVPLASRAGAEWPAKAHMRDGDAQRRVTPGLAVLALLLLTCLVAIGLTAYIDVSRAFSLRGGAGQTPAAAGTGTSPMASPGTVPTAPGRTVPVSPTPTPIAPLTPPSSPEPTTPPTTTAAGIAQPTATASIPTATAASTATAVAQPTQPAATDTAQATASAATQPAQTPGAQDMPGPAQGAP